MGGFLPHRSERTATMTNATTEQTSTLLLKDSEGNYFVLPQETLKRHRVSEEHKDEIEGLLATERDVQGYATNELWKLASKLLPFLELTPLSVIIAGGVLIADQAGVLDDILAPIEIPGL
jgi:hypothetical protein